MTKNFEHDRNLIFHIISTARSGSTAFMRALAWFLKAKIFSEPAIASSAFAFDNDWIPFLGTVPEAFMTYEGVDKVILQAHLEGHVVVKDVVHAIIPYLEKGTSPLLSHPDVQYIFLIREPYQILESLFRLNPNLNFWIENFYSFEKMQQLHSQINDLHTNGVLLRPPIVVDGNEFFNQPEEGLASLATDLELDPSRLSSGPVELEPVTYEQAVTLWNETSNEETFNRWHGKAAQSRSLTALPSFEVDQNGYPTFNEIHSDYLPDYEKKYFEMLPYYLQLKGLLDFDS